MYQPGDIVAGRFELEAQIGQGGAGTIFRANQTSLDRVVALKVLHSESAFAADARRRFAREARAIARLNHPHIASVYDFGIDDDNTTLWIAMELIEGEELRAMKYQPFDIIRTLSVFDQIASALSSAHARDIIHRDLKLSNVLIAKNDDGNEIAKLVDFGLAFSAEKALSLENAPGIGNEHSVAANHILGTPRYMAPEILLGQTVDHRVDLYAIGVMLFEIVTGDAPFTGEMEEVVRGHIRTPPPEVIPRDGVTAPPELQELVHRLMTKDPNVRTESAAELRDDIARILGEFSYSPWMLGPDMRGAGGEISTFDGIYLEKFGDRTISPVDLMRGEAAFIADVKDSGPLVNRDEEKRGVEDAILACIKRRTGGALLIRGEQGIGKSRLAEWSRVRVDEGGLMRTVTGQFPENGGYRAVRSVLEVLLHLRGLAFEEVHQGIKQRLVRWDMSEEEIALCYEFMVPQFDEREGLHPERLQKLFSLIERIFREVAVARPLLIVFENLEYASERVFELLEHLVMGLYLHPSPILVMATIQGDGLSADVRSSIARLTQFQNNFRIVDVGPLSLESCVNLVQNVAPIGEPLAQEIARRSHGNPMQILETLRWLVQSEKLSMAGPTWDLVKGAELGSDLPSNILQMMKSRREKVIASYHDQDAAREVLQACAILGYQVEIPLFAEFVDAGSIARYQDALNYLLDQSIFSLEGDDVLTFHHPTMRDTILVEIAQDRTIREQHEKAASTKIEYYGKRKNVFAEEIAEHYRKARNVEGAYFYTVRAASRAMAEGDLIRAIEFYREADQIDRAGGGISTEGLSETSTVLDAVEVRMEVAHLERRTGEFDSARAQYRELLRERAPEVGAWAQWGLGRIALEQGELSEAETWLEASQTGIAAVEDQGEKQRIRAACAIGFARILCARGDYDSGASMLSEALSVAQRGSNREWEYEILHELTSVLWTIGRVDVARVYLGRMEILCERKSDISHIADFHLLEARFARESGEPERAKQSLEQAKRVFDKTGARLGQIHCLVESAMIDFGAGELQAARVELRNALQLFVTLGDKRNVASTELLLARVSRKTDAETHFQRAATSFEAIGDKRGMVETSLYQGIDRGDLSKIRVALNSAREIGDKRLVATALSYVALAGEDPAKNVEEMLAVLDEVPVFTPEILESLDALASIVASYDPELILFVESESSAVKIGLGRGR